MKHLNDGESHKILFSRGNLYLDGVQIGGHGIIPAKDIMFEFKLSGDPIEVNVPKPIEPSDTAIIPPLLEVNVHDDVKNKDVGPGQR